MAAKAVKRYSDEEKQKFLADVAGGTSIRKAAAKAGFSYPTGLKYAHKANGTSTAKGNSVQKLFKQLCEAIAAQERVKLEQRMMHQLRKAL